MKMAFLFPGQGTQSVGMGRDLYEKFGEVREVYDDASRITNYDIADITFNSSDEMLTETGYAQITILTMSLGILKILEENGIKPDMAAGLSLGEYAALIAGHSLSYNEGFFIVDRRGLGMQELVPEGKWKMAAVLGLEDKVVEEACKNVKEGFVAPSNYNCVGQVTISGNEEGVDKACEYLKKAGAKKIVPLKTSGPFHTEKMDDAAFYFCSQTEYIVFNQPDIEVIKNIDGKPYEENDNIGEILVEHITHPVRFRETIDYMLKNGVDTFVEIGPGKTLTGFVRKASKDVKTYNINDVESLENFLNDMKN